MSITRSISSVTWFITSKCNLGCKYCFTAFDSGFPREDSSLEVGKAAIDFLLLNTNSQNAGFSFFGGEPLLKFNLLKEVVEYGRERAKLCRRNINFGITTNGTMLADDIIVWLKENRLNIVYSMDGLPHEDNQRNFLSGMPSGAVALENAKKLLDAGLRPVIRWTVVPGQLANLYSDLKALVEMGFEIIAPEPVYEVEWTDDDKALYEAELRKVAKYYLQRLRDGRTLSIKPIDDAFRMFAVEEKQKSRCGTATGGVGIDMAGKLYPCHRFVTRMGPVLGDVFSGWDEAALKEAQAWDVAKVHPETGACKDCPINLRCPGGGCICVNLDMCGDIYTSPRLYCELQLINQRVTNDIAFILHGEKNAIFEQKLKRPDMPS